MAYDESEFLVHKKTRWISAPTTLEGKVISGVLLESGLWKALPQQQSVYQQSTRRSVPVPYLKCRKVIRAACVHKT